MEQQQKLPSSGSWIKGIVIDIKREYQYGFIRAQTELPASYTNRDVHFMLQKVSWDVQVNENVEFQLDKRKHDKPSAFAIRPVESHSIAPAPSKQYPTIPQASSLSRYECETADGNNVTTAMQPVLSKRARSGVRNNTDSHSCSSFQLEFTPKRQALYEERRQGKVAKVQDKYGFIRSDTITPSLAAHGADLYFSVGSSHTGHFRLVQGDQVSFYVQRVRESSQLQAGNVRLVKCCDRPVEIIEDYIKSLLDKVAHSDVVESREHVIVATTCLPVWECIGRISNITGTDNGLRMLVELLIQLNEKEFLKENAAVLLETLHKTPLFVPSGGRLSCYMNDLVTRGLTDELSKVHHLIVLMAQRVPKCGRQITDFVKPLISNEKGSCEKLLYQLLRQFTKGSAGAIENMQWNELPLVPSVDELVSGKLESYSSLQRVIQKGAYPSTESYIDTYFRLLRVDCFSAMAKGVTDLIGGRLDSRDMNVYRGIRLAGVQLTRSGNCSGLSIGIAVTPHQKVNWEQQSYHLMYGNLLCISVSGTFQDPIWATVASRDLLKTHQVVVIELVSEHNSGSNSESLLALYFAGPSSVMVESPTYYRAYQPVLRALQNTDTEQMSFKDELIKCQQGTCPEYITADTELNASIIYTQMQPSLQKLNAMCYRVDELSLGMTTLDASQETAIKECLRNRVAIIQGPPGTGKTFVGVKIVELLLSVSTPLRLPILILTYKNHSLDEFLKEMVKLMPQSVARVGGRSQEKELSSRTLNELRRSTDYRVSEPVYKEIMYFKAEMDRLKQEIDDVFDRIEEQKYFSVDSLLQFFVHEQLAVFLFKCDWSKTKQKPFNSDKSGWKTVSKRIKYQEVSELVGSCGQSTIQELVEAGRSDKDSLGTKLYQLLESALGLWIPNVEDFQAFEQSFATNQGSVLGRYEQLAKTETSANNDWRSAELDTDETVQERLAASLAKQTSAHELLKNFKTFGSSRGHLLKTDRDIVKKTAAGSLTGTRNLWDLNINDRILLIQHLLQQKFAEAGQYFEGLLAEYEKMYRTKQELEDQQKVIILQGMKIIGMTVTGANIYRNLIAQIRPEVILVEEAAEVLEPQLVALMGNWVKHLIMIGDHKQLRPSVENYKLAREYHLDLSMMERMINNGLSYATLTMQNRMRPEFAELLLDIYPKLQSNLARVEANKPANCIGRSMYFWNHQEPETKERSFINKAEAERALRLALFLIEQGYRPSQITILSPYLGQVRLIRRMVKGAEKEFADLFVTEETRAESTAGEGDVSPATDNSIKVHTVDLYQGDENDFVIVSLVRSNDGGNIGFLNVLNRRCVAQSRAQCGLYFIGNRQTLSRNKDWNVLIEGLAKSQCVDTFIPLHCPFHPAETRLLVSSHDQIPVQQSFCGIICGRLMPCKLHVCEKTCQPRHSHMICRKRVRFVFSKCGHSQEKQCHEDEDDLTCKTEVSFRFTRCNHLGYRKCYQKNEDMTCSEKCTKILSCTHPCERKCGEPCNNDNCSVCQKIREAEEEKRRQAEEMQRENIREEARQRIEEIKKQNPDDCVHREELRCDGDRAEEYFSIEDRVKKYIVPGHNWFPHVTRIEKLTNLKLEIAWLEAKAEVFDPTRCDWKFHGTTAERCNSIIQSGFRLPKKERQMYGPGIYFATDSSKSAQEQYTKGSNMLLLCEVLIGKAKTVVTACPHMTPRKIRDEGYDSLFAKRGTQRSGGVRNDEFVLFNPKQAIPRYVVHYDEMDHAGLFDNINMALMPANQTMIKHNILPPRRARNFDTLEVHFCLAESHFSRLMVTKSKTYEVESVDLYLNPTLMRKFKLKQAELEAKYPVGDKSKPILAFHGTKSANIDKIVQENFDLSKLASNTGDRGYYGAGIYFSEFPEVSIGYAKIGKLLLCKVLPGKSHDCEDMMLGQALQPGYDSHRVSADKEGRGQELVIFDADQILPCYVVNYK